MAISQQDYFLKPGETIGAYNARIAALEAREATPAPAPAPGLDVIVDPVTGKSYSRDASVPGSTYSPYVAPVPVPYTPGTPIVDFTKSLDQPAQQPQANTYTVRSGDTISGIAKQLGVSASSITGYRSGNPNLIYPGEVLKIGGVAQAPAPSPKPSPQPAPQPAPPPAVQTSASERLKQRTEELRQVFGEPPSQPDLFAEADRGKLDIARQERSAIDTELASILNERMTIADEFTKFKAQQVGLPAEGRTGAIEERGRQLQEQLSALDRRELVLETKLRNRNTVIGELMGLQGQEYSDAVAQYNTRFSQALQLYGIFDKEDAEDKQNTKANLDVYFNAFAAQIQAGQLTPEQITGIQQAKIEELETQIGYPIGSTMAMLSTLKPDEEKLYSGVDDFGNFVYITKDTNNQLRMETLKGAMPQRQPQGARGRKGDHIATALADSRGADGYADPNVYLREQRTAGLSPDQFNNKYGDWLSPQERQRLGVLGEAYGTDAIEKAIDELSVPWWKKFF